MSTNYINKVTDTAGTTHDIMEGVDTRIFRATCSTAANTAAKVAVLEDATNYTLTTGVRVAVTFTYGNDTAMPSLNVNNGGAKTIATPASATTVVSGNGTTYNTWGPYETVVFTYDGTYWVKGATSYSIYNAFSAVTSGGHEELSQAEYDALSQAEKENGTVYFINDGVPEGLIVNDSVPIGAIQAYGGSVAPNGWLFCQGQEVSRTTYSELFATIGTTYGNGDGSTTFNLPNLKGKIAIGSDTNYALGTSGGEATHTLTTDEMPSHTHIQNSHNHTQNSHNHTQNSHSHSVNSSPVTVNAPAASDQTFYYGGQSYPLHYGTPTTTGVTATNQATTATNQATTATNQNTGGGTAHNNMQPYIVTNYIIKAKDNSVLHTNLLPMLDMFYPVGSYYETSDTTFDPNIAWGGEWSLEAEGQVHVSAGSSSSYTIGTTGGSATRSYTPAGTVGNTTLSASQMPYHRHTYNSPNANTGGTAITKANLPNIQLRVGQNMSSLGVSGTWYLTYDTVQTQGSQASARLSSSANGAWAYTEALGSGTTHSHTIGTTSSNTGYAGGSSGTTQAHNHGFTGTAASINIMQPYVAINRWHRTA